MESLGSVVCAHWKRVLLTFAGVLGPLCALGNPYRLNLREHCRLMVSDLSISLWNDEKMYREQSEQLSKKLTSLRAEKKLLDKHLLDLQGAKENSLGDGQWNQKAAGLSYQVDTLTAQIADLEPLAAESKKRAEERKKQSAEFEQRIKPLFRRIPLDVKAGDLPHELAFRLDFVKECSAYNQLCPLDPTSAKLLQSLAEDLPKLASALGKQLDATTCDRYSRLRYRGE